VETKKSVSNSNQDT